MHKRTYIIKIKVKSRSNFQLGNIESTLVSIINLFNEKNNVDAKIHITEKEIPSEFIGRELKTGEPASFVPINSRGEKLMDTECLL